MTVHIPFLPLIPEHNLIHIGLCSKSPDVNTGDLGFKDDRRGIIQSKLTFGVL
jgi:hypothetical protein